MGYRISNGSWLAAVVAAAVALGVLAAAPAQAGLSTARARSVASDVSVVPTFATHPTIVNGLPVPPDRVDPTRITSARINPPLTTAGADIGPADSTTYFGGYTSIAYDDNPRTFEAQITAPQLACEGTTGYSESWVMANAWDGWAFAGGGGWVGMCLSEQDYFYPIVVAPDGDLTFGRLASNPGTVRVTYGRGIFSFDVTIVVFADGHNVVDGFPVQSVDHIEFGEGLDFSGWPLAPMQFAIFQNMRIGGRELTSGDVRALDLRDAGGRIVRHPGTFINPIHGYVLWGPS